MCGAGHLEYICPPVQRYIFWWIWKKCFKRGTYFRMPYLSFLVPRRAGFSSQLLPYRKGPKRFPAKHFFYKFKVLSIYFIILLLVLALIRYFTLRSIFSVIDFKFSFQCSHCRSTWTPSWRGRPPTPTKPPSTHRRVFILTSKVVNLSGQVPTDFSSSSRGGGLWE